MAKKKTLKRKTKKIISKGPKVTTVQAHQRHVPVSKKNPEGITIVDQHPRHIWGNYIEVLQIEDVVKDYDKTNIKYPAKNDLGFKENGSKYDELIAIWTDFFNKKFDSKSPMDPDCIKALIASESGFKAFDSSNKKAFGIAQITRQTFKILKDPKDEAKKFIFKDAKFKDLENPAIAIPMGIRWLFRKKEIAKSKLGREPTHEEIILEYKGLLKSNTDWKKSALQSYRKNYGKLKSNK